MLLSTRPAGPLRLALGSSICNGINFAWAPLSNDSVSGAIGQYVGPTGPTYGHGRYGIHFHSVANSFFPNTFSFSGTEPFTTNVPANQATMMCVLNSYGTVTGTVGSNLFGTSGPNGLAINTSNQLAISTNNPSMHSIGTVPSSGGVFIATFQPYNQGRFFLNGKYDTSVSDPGYGWVGNILYLGGEYGQGSITADFVLCVAWRRILNDNEIYSLSENPWQMFRPTLEIDYFKLMTITSTNIFPTDVFSFGGSL